MKTWSQKIVDFNRKLKYTGELPPGFGVMNPFLENPQTLHVMQQFYDKFYNDHHQRRFIIGINPSRHGAGLTGVPFTDTKRLEKVCGIRLENRHSHEPSSVFMYEAIEYYGGVQKFYSDFYINSPFPLAIIRNNGQGKWLNANYYDDKRLFEAVAPFMIQSLKKHMALGLDSQEVYVLGKKNAIFIKQLNAQAKLFEKIVVLDHPRYIQQYRSKDKALFLDEYFNALHKNGSWAAKDT